MGRDDAIAARWRVDAFTAFFEAHERRLRAFALRRVGDPVRADDLVAAVMEVAWRRFELVRPGVEFGWLCGIAIRVAANNDRMGARRQRFTDRLIVETEAGPLVAYLDSDRLLEEQRTVIVSAFDRLPERDWELLRLVVWDELTDEELAAALRCSAPAARKRLSRARARFRQLYAGVVHEAPPRTDS